MTLGVGGVTDFLSERLDLVGVLFPARENLVEVEVSGCLARVGHVTRHTQTLLLMTHTPQQHREVMHIYP